MGAVVVHVGGGLGLIECVEECRDIEEVGVSVVGKICEAVEDEDVVIFGCVELAELVAGELDEVHMFSAVNPLVVGVPETGVDGDLVLCIGDWVMGGVDTPLHVIDCLVWVFECDLSLIVWAEEGDCKCRGLIVCEVTQITCVDASTDICIVVELDNERGVLIDCDAVETLGVCLDVCVARVGGHESPSIEYDGLVVEVK